MLADRRVRRLASLASRLAAVVPRHVCAPRLLQGCCQMSGPPPSPQPPSRLQLPRPTGDPKAKSVSDLQV